MKERDSVWEVRCTVPSSLSFVLHLLRCIFAVVSQGLSVNLLEILLHPLALILVDSCSLPSKQGTKAGCESTARREIVMLLGPEQGA